MRIARTPALAALALLTTLAAHARAAPIYQTINGSFAPGDGCWAGGDSLGWYWTPPTDVDLAGIQTQLSTGININNNFTFTAAVYTDRPAISGAVLDSFDWNGTTFLDGPWLGGSFASPLHLTGGTTYFLGFRGWALASGWAGGLSGAGVMMVGPDFAVDFRSPTAGTTVLEGWCDIGLGGTPPLFTTALDANSWVNTPILRLIAVPEPASLALFALGGLALAARRRPER